MSVIKDIKDWVTGLEFIAEVLSYSDDGTNTTLVLDHLFAIGVGRKVNVDGVDFDVLSVSYYDCSIVVPGVLINPVEVQMPSLSFKSGSYYQVTSEVSFEDEIDIYPLFYMNVPYRTRNRNADAIRETIRANFVICDVANYQDWSTEDFEEKSEQLAAFSDYLFSQVQNDYRFGNVDMTNKQVYYKYGELSSKNVPENSVFNNRLTGVKLDWNIPFFKCCKK